MASRSTLLIGPRIVLRSARLPDVSVLRQWDVQRHVVFARGEDGAFDWENEIPRDVDWREVLIGEDLGRSIGVLQIIDPAREESHYWGDAEPHLRAIDIWVGEASDLGRGYGAEMMRLAIAHCFSAEAVTAILVDPLVKNGRAQKFFERHGFRGIGRRSFDGDECLVMRLDRRHFMGS